jgi:hypothetical protein
MNYPWTKEQDKIILTHYRQKGAPLVAELTGRSIGGVRQRASRLGVEYNKKQPDPRKRRKLNRLEGYTKASEIKIKGKGPAMTVMGTKIRAAQFVGEPKITAETRVTIARPFVDTRFVPVGPVPRVVDPAQCRAWAGEVWREHDNAGMRYPERCDLIGGATDCAA